MLEDLNGQAVLRRAVQVRHGLANSAPSWRGLFKQRDSKGKRKRARVTHFGELGVVLEDPTLPINWAEAYDKRVLCIDRGSGLHDFTVVILVCSASISKRADSVTTRVAGDNNVFQS